MYRGKIFWLVLATAVTTAVSIDEDESPAIGACLCVTDNIVNARNAGGLHGTVVAKVSDPSCYKFKGGIRVSNNLTWYELKDVGGKDSAWVAGKYLYILNDELCAGYCNVGSKWAACMVLGLAVGGEIRLWDKHVSGEIDNAFPYNNVRDTCNGRAAARSHYPCEECLSPGAPGGHICLDYRVLSFIHTLYYYKLAGLVPSVSVNELAGACHSCRSYHYEGLAVDVNYNGTLDLFGLFSDLTRMQDLCDFMGGWNHYDKSHFHCDFRE
ncbi:uncharacterized protein LOC123557559 [Mercenaria mercenaria]|uniref:uncharacterized protein LOC123557559 n=1 Tax=Mercenaria mercenaria TaxID=6596 RepID=UPI00234E5DAA|nr:uncharacterized protein LOC123557559 [Mercenaria mercenaria]